MHDPESGELSVMIVNQSDKERVIRIPSSAGFKSARHQVFAGKAANDNWGTLSETTVHLDADTVFVLPPSSANAVTFTAK
jgi:hypothetical protein